MSELILTPAYGRDYNSKDAVLKDYNDGKDFMMQPQGCYCSNRDFYGSVLPIKFRYAKLRKVFYL